MTAIPQARLKPKEDRRLLRGHRWAYRNEFAQLPALDDGALVDVLNAEGRPVGRGFYQKEGGIGVRLLDGRAVEVDAAFWSARLDEARAFRERCFPGSDVYRWVFGESDALPGLVIDRYASLASVHTSCRFYDNHQSEIIAALLDTPGIRTVTFDFNNRRSLHGEECSEVAFSVEGMQLSLPLQGTQKTGLFLDQRLNRVAIEPWCKGARVLDGHCYHGLWSLHAARAGAVSVLGVDTSADAVRCAEANATANGVGNVCQFEARAIEDALDDDAMYDVVIIDPPAFAKARAHTAAALKRYRQLNAAAMERVAPGGILVSCSCSHFVEPADFLDVIKQAASSVQRKVWLIEMRGAAPDHPVLLAMPETAYLKCAVLRVG
ncbi:MAG: hypothetical protein RLZZ303_1876 [Candidatus Hydrogenedentota bacterium]|jgi:23S rRNA (cytosine1962-C5)-methyltransferase